MLKDKKILIGVTGGIAAYKALDLISKLIKEGAKVKVIMTKSATEFVAPITFQSISQNFVTTDMFEEIKSWEVEHIELAKWADLMMIVPATANIIGKVAGGIADDMLSTVIMATKSKVIFAPAMNTNMYENEFFKNNIKKLECNGYLVLGTDSGRLACGDYGYGKLINIEKIFEFIKENFTKNEALSGKKILVTAGATIERIDPVRYITNNSSGKMGYSLAKECKMLGAEVILVSGPTNLEKPYGIEIIDVETTEEMYEVVKENFKNCDILIKSAAPLDYRYKNYSEEKIKKQKNTLNLEFEKTVDILKNVGKDKKKGQILIGFAAESEKLVENARKKLLEKNLDIIIANNIKKKDIGFKSNYNEVVIITKDKEEYLEKSLKSDISKKIIERIIKYIEVKSL